MKLPSLRGFLVFPEGFDAARIQLRYKDYPSVAAPYEPRENVEPLSFIADDDAEDANGEAGGREGNATPDILIENKPPTQAIPVIRAGLTDDIVAEADKTPDAKSTPTADMTPERQALTDRIYKGGAAVQSNEVKSDPVLGQEQDRLGKDEPHSGSPVAPNQYRLDLSRRELGEAIEPESRAERSVSAPDHGLDDGQEL